MNIDNFLNRINRFFFNMDSHSDLRLVGSEVLRVIGVNLNSERVATGT